MMDSYCKAHSDNDYCTKINQYVTGAFCQIACKGDAKRYYSPPLDELRAKYRLDLTKEEKLDKDIISVIIPVCKADEQYLKRTIASLRDNAVGAVEVIIEGDKKNEGLRVLMNRGVKKARGKYVMKLDAHCAMSPEWDARMKASCQPDTIIKPMLDTLEPETWKGKGKDMGFVGLDKEMRNQFLNSWKSLLDRSIEEETLSLIGCCFMMEKEYYERYGGCDESLGNWGALGLEWALKTWLTGGRVLIRTDTVCCHLFRYDKPFECDEEQLNKNFKLLGRKWYAGLGEGQTKPLPWLLHKFAPYMANIKVAARDQRTPARFAANGV